MTDTTDDYYARGFPPQIFVEAWGGRWSRHADGTQEMEYVRADRIEELEAKLAKAVENTLDAASAYMTEQYGISALSHPVDRARVIAPLAELKGQTNE